ncbi:hypothetical protein FQN54_000008 [Arachnomyces sp. PD_36]|nr:hypothetical protein FQN54_000008 [Arachnomyces sp. PD_36]
MRLASIIVGGLTAIGFVQACETDEDCSLNGVCSRQPGGYDRNQTQTCECDPGWFGEDCGHLDLAPATKLNGYNHTDATSPDHFGDYGNSSWGGQIMQDSENPKLFHLFTSQFAHGCGLSGWRPSSFIIRAESTTGPQGPYHYAQTVTEPFRHNPQVLWSPADEKYLLYSIGVDAPEAEKCESISYEEWPNNISVSSAETIRGPWTTQKMILDSRSPQSTNPAPWPLWSPEQDTSQIALGVEDNAIFLADKWDGEYELLVTQKWNTSETSPTWTEDMFLWRDKRGHWHALDHWMIDLVEHDGRKYPRVGAHIYARELGGPWHFKLHEAFNSTVNYTDGSIQTLQRRERAKLFFSDDGEMTPLYLTTGVQEMGESGLSSTLIQPVGTKWQDYERGLGL